MTIVEEWQGRAYDAMRRVDDQKVLARRARDLCADAGPSTRTRWIGPWTTARPSAASCRTPNTEITRGARRRGAGRLGSGGGEEEASSAAWRIWLPKVKAPWDPEVVGHRDPELGMAPSVVRDGPFVAHRASRQLASDGLFASPSARVRAEQDEEVGDPRAVSVDFSRFISALTGAMIDTEMMADDEGRVEGVVLLHGAGGT